MLDRNGFVNAETIIGGFGPIQGEPVNNSLDAGQQRICQRVNDHWWFWPNPRRTREQSAAVSNLLLCLPSQLVTLVAMT
jgi:hypothetical protein